MTTHTRVCSRHIRPSDYRPSLAGRKSTFCITLEEEFPIKTEGANEKKSIKRKKATEKTTAKADLPTCDSSCEVFVEPQETPLLSSITKNLENTTVDQPADDSQTIIRDIQIENEIGS